MNSVHDMGGMQGFGAVNPETNEPLFHAPWERRALALTLAMGATGQWTIDHARAARESLPPGVYLNSSYYEIWLRGLEHLLIKRGLATAEELKDGQLRQPADRALPVLTAERVASVLAKGTSAERSANQHGSPPRHVVGERVRARNMHPGGHTRLPRYVRGHVGTVLAVRGCHVWPDSHVSRQLPPFEETAHWLYTVAFEAQELWGEQAAGDNTEICVDAWEPYLEPCELALSRSGPHDLGLHLGPDPGPNPPPNQANG